MATRHPHPLDCEVSHLDLGCHHGAGLRWGVSRSEGYSILCFLHQYRNGVRHNRKRCWYGRPRYQLDHQSLPSLRLALHLASDFWKHLETKFRSSIRATGCFYVQSPCPHGEHKEGLSRRNGIMKRKRKMNSM